MVVVNYDADDNDDNDDGIDNHHDNGDDGDDDVGEEEEEEEKEEDNDDHDDNNNEERKRRWLCRENKNICPKQNGLLILYFLQYHFKNSKVISCLRVKIRRNV